jgi:hypothetical protein
MQGHLGMIINGDGHWRKSRYQVGDSNQVSVSNFY